jgi:hypothetical protein
VLLTVEETWTRADHQTHRRYPFEVPPGCALLSIRVRYGPKYLDAADSRRIIEHAVRVQATALRPRLGSLTEPWAAFYVQALPTDLRLGNMLTMSLDDAHGVYRGAGHRQAPDQRWTLGDGECSAGLVPGPLPAGTWRLTLSAHTLVSPTVDVSIQIGAEIASSEPSSLRRSA